ncbi:hypothetical protein ACHABX_02860 [Nesterenkonia halotolerans]|uniref:hypothetical protein n=1 Tax=Nesterenkonia halotolerans TaxID=225325 RepID=UPI003EE7201D
MAPGDSVTPDFNAPRPPRRFTQARPRPVAVWVLFLILFIQGMALAFNAVASALTSQAQVLDAAGAIALVVLYVLFGLVLVLLGFRIFLGAQGARTPAMVVELLIVVLSFSFFSGGLPAVGVAFVLPAAVALVLLFIRPTQVWLSEADPQD